MSIPYAYKLTQLSTSKWYIGCRYAAGCSPDDDYMSSSRTVQALYRANPVDWIKTVIMQGTAKEVYDFETLLLRILDAKNDHGSFNQHNNDGFGAVYKGAWNAGLKLTTKQSGWTTERREAASQRLLGKPSRALGSKWSEEAKAQRSIDFTGKIKSTEHRAALSRALIGHPNYYHGKTRV